MLKRHPITKRILALVSTMIFILTDWKTPDLLHLFSPFGSVQVFWETDTTAYVSLREHVKNAKSVVMSTLNCSSIYKIAPYEIHKKTEMVYKTFNNTHNTSGITPMLEKATPFIMEKPSGKRGQQVERPKATSVRNSMNSMGYYEIAENDT